MARVTIEIPPEPAAIRIARVAAGAAARRAGLDSDTADDVRLAVSEACASTLTASGVHGSDGDDAITLELHDSQGFEAVITGRSSVSSGAVDDGLDELELATHVMSALAPRYVCEHEGGKVRHQLWWPVIDLNA